jgi:hypothetical protein
MRFASTLAAAVALTSSTVSAFVAPSSSISTATTTDLKMSEVEQPDVSAYMTGARPVSAKFSICILFFANTIEVQNEQRRLI